MTSDDWARRELQLLIGVCEVLGITLDDLVPKLAARGYFEDEPEPEPEEDGRRDGA